MAPNHERNLIRVEVQGHIEEIVSLLISITNQILERIFQTSEYSQLTSSFFFIFFNGNGVPKMTSQDFSTVNVI